ncbi:hypothetical protein [Companilactobacillus zhongbaensis]|nr:hypothetical protein [Companilactobacillus zhongbaensis]
MNKVNTKKIQSQTNFQKRVKTKVPKPATEKERKVIKLNFKLKISKQQ